ncbi:MAG: hypothetical protein AAF266_10555 [Planctomycetota bacterium]
MKRLWMPVLAALAAIGTTGSAAAQNLLINPDFELPSFFGWSTFNNTFPVSISPEDPNLPTRSGNSSGLILGPFFNLPNASGIFQDVPISEGEIAVGSIFAINDSTRLNDSNEPDIIAGTGNVLDLAIEWIDGSGNNLGQAAITRIFDGQDPDLPLDEFVQGTVISPPAPANAAEARLVLLFVQPPTFDGGVVFFDDASLSIIPEPTSAALAGCLGLGVLARRRHR